jgi:hypothetical protein
MMTLVVIAGAALAVYAIRDIAPPAPAQATTQSALQTHLVGGLQHPLGAQSDFPRKFHGVVAGIKSGFTQPFGIGTASANIASTKFGGATSGGESDLPTAFSALGLVGGLLFVSILVLVIRRGSKVYLARRDFVSAAALGVILATLGQWLNGAYYSVAPILWLSIGWICREYMRRDEHA